MRRDYSRTDRVSQQMQKEIAVILQREIKDPRVGMATVSSVDVSKDLSFARVYITFYNSDDVQMNKAVEILNEASGFIRSLIGKRIRARVVPELRFVLDTSLISGMQISNLVDEVMAKDRKKQQQSEDEDSAEQNKDGEA